MQKMLIQVQAFVHRDVSLLLKRLFHPRSDWPENRKMEKLDANGNADWDNIITIDENTTNGL